MSETGPPFSVEVSADGRGTVDFTVTRPGITALISVETDQTTDAETEEFFRLLPAVIDQGLDALLAQQEGTPS